MSEPEDKRKAIQGGIGSAEGAEMVVDIVTRLRRVTEIKRYNDFTEEMEVVATFTTSSDAREAADEIERLRNALEQCEAERDTWRTVAETEHIRFTNELKAVRGE